jgi:hypothetical protein
MEPRSLQCNLLIRHGGEPGGSLNRPGNCGDSFAWKGKSNVHTEEEANAAGEAATTVWCPAEVSG